MAATEIVNCDGIIKTYGTIVALNTITLTISEGESVALIGANGAGKSTLFTLILGLTKPDHGACSILGTPSGALAPHHRARTGFIADHAGPIPWASPHDLAILYAKIYPGWNQEKFESLTALWTIDTYRRLNRLSKGQKRLAEIALVAALQPKILILDEPFDGLDAVMRIKVQKLLRTMQYNDGATVLYATHIISEVASVADRMLVLRNGNLVYDELIDNAPESPEAVFRKLYSAEIEG